MVFFIDQKIRHNSNVSFIDAFKQDITFILGKITRALIMQLRGLSDQRKTT